MFAADMYFFSQVTFISLNLILAFFFCAVSCLSAAQTEFKWSYGETVNDIILDSRVVSLMIADASIDAGIFLSIFVYALLGSLAWFLNAFTPFALSSAVTMFAVLFIVTEEVNRNYLAYINIHKEDETIKID